VVLVASFLRKSAQESNKTGSIAIRKKLGINGCGSRFHEIGKDLIWVNFSKSNLQNSPFSPSVIPPQVHGILSFGKTG
jgi:hypothetical protein